MARKLFENRKKEVAALRIQKNSRRYFARKSYDQRRSSLIVLQSGYRRMSARNEYRLRKKTKAAIIIQAQWRCYAASTQYKKLKRTAVHVQSKGSGRLSGNELESVSRETGETNELNESNDTFQNPTDTPELGETKDGSQSRIDELTCQLQLEKSLRAELEEAKRLEIMNLQNSLNAMQKKLEETNMMHMREGKVAVIEGVVPNVVTEIPVPDEATENIDLETADAECLKALLQSEKQRSLHFKKLYNEAQESNEERRLKLEETEVKVDQLQETLSRMMQGFSNQILELKMILCTSSSSISTASPNNRVDAAFNSSDFPQPVPTPVAVSSLTPDALRQIVQELSPSKNSGLDKLESDKEGAFDEFF